MSLAMPGCSAHPARRRTPETVSEQDLGMIATARDTGDHVHPRTGVALAAWRGWPPLLGLPAAVILLVPPYWPPWALMWSLAASIYAGCKWLTWRRTPVENLPWWRHAGYLFACPGLDAAAFLTAAATTPPG